MYYEEPDEESVIGMIGDYIAFGETKGDFEEMVEAFEGEGLNESQKFKEAMEGAPDEGIGTVYVDIGGLIEETKSVLPPETEAFFDLVQIEPKKATAVATVIPRSEQLEIDVSSNLGKSLTRDRRRLGGAGSAARDRRRSASPPPNSARASAKGSKRSATKASPARSNRANWARPSKRWGST